MAKYYNADTLLEYVKNNTPTINGHTSMKCVERAIKEAPTADVVEVVHGWWVTRKSIHNEEFYVCSVCGTANDDILRYCPICGAKMDGTLKERGGEK